MKKVFCVFAVVLIVTTSLNASSITAIEFNNEATCFGYADKWATRVGFWNSLSHEQEHQVFLSLYDECMDQ